MKHSLLLALSLTAGLFSAACAQLETCESGKDWSPCKGQDAPGCDDTGAPCNGPTTGPRDNALEENNQFFISSQAIPTGDPATSELLLTKSLPKVIQRDQEFGYNLVVENLGRDPLSHVVLQERLPEGFTLVGSDPTVDSNSENLAVWNLGTLNSGETKSVTITGLATADGESASYAMVSYDRSLKGEFQVVSPNLTLELSGPETTVPGEPFEIQVTVNNTGSGSAQRVDVASVLPEGLLTEDGQDSSKWVVENLAPGASETFTVSAHATRSGSFATTAQASLAKGDPITVTGGAIQVQDTRLEVLATGPSKFYLGQPGKILLTVKNVGGSIAKEVQLAQVLPAGIELVRSSSPAENLEGTLSWNLGDLEPGTETAITLYLMPSQAGTLDLVASAQAATGAPAEGTYSAPMEGISALNFTIEDLQDPVPVGESLTYLIKVENQGTAAGSDIAIVVTMDEGMQLVHAKGPTNGRTEGNKVLFNALESLEPGATATWQLVLQSRQIGDLRLSAALTSKRLQRPVEVTQSTQFYQ